MKAWNQITHYAGFDWAKDHHDVIVLDGGGKIVADFRFEHTAGGWEQFREKLAAFAGVAVAIETKSGTVVERLQEIDCCIFPVHPQSAKAYRQRKVPSGNKTDHVDAWSLADALRLDEEATGCAGLDQPPVCYAVRPVHGLRGRKRGYLAS